MRARTTIVILTIGTFILGVSWLVSWKLTGREQDKFDAARSTYQQLVVKRDTTRSTALDRKQQRLDSEHQLLSLRTSVSTLNARISQQEAEVERMVAQFKSEHALWLKKNTELTEQAEAAERLLSPLDVEAKRLAAEADALEKRNGEVKAELDKLTTQLNDLNGRLAETNAECDKLIAEAKPVRERIETLERETRNAQSDIDSFLRRQQEFNSAIAIFNAGPKTFEQDQFDFRKHKFGRMFESELCGRANAVSAAGAWPADAARIALFSLSGSSDGKGRKFDKMDDWMSSYAVQVYEEHLRMQQIIRDAPIRMDSR